jgi:hypothetical protein
MSDSPPIRYENSVFINCPFDADYQPIFRALVFAVQDLGFAVRCALERDDSAENRLQKLYDLIAACKYGIHDLSRAERHSPDLPRFNMPFELGLFFGCREYGSRRHRQKVALILDSDKYRYLEFITDLRGMDIKSHGNNPQKAVRAVRSWLGPSPERTKHHGADAIWHRYQQFEGDLPGLCAERSLTPEELTFPETALLMQQYIIVLDEQNSEQN